MNELERLSIQRECERVEITMMRAVDAGEYDQAASLFAEDAELDLGTSLEGRAAILGWLSERPKELRSRHILTNIVVEVADAHYARSTSHLTLFRHVGPESVRSGPVDRVDPAAIGDYETDFTRDGDRWLIKRRSLQLVFRRTDF